MGLPGEKLVERMWETVTEKGIGNLLKPWHERRLELARTDILVDRKLRLAEADRIIEGSQHEHARLLFSATTSMLGSGSAERTISPSTHDPSEEEGPAKIAAASIVADAIRKEVNTSKALLHADAVLAEDPQDPPTDQPTADWLFRWRDAASAVSSDEMQHLWGQVLAGEVKVPGSFSLRTIAFLRNISQEEAQSIEKVSTVVLRDIIWRESAILDQLGINFQLLISMQDLGLISGVEGGGFEWTALSQRKGSYMRPLFARDRVIVIEHPDEQREVRLPVYKITRVGQQVFALGDVKSDEYYLRSVGAVLCQRGFAVTLANAVPAGYDEVTMSEPIVLCTAQTVAP